MAKQATKTAAKPAPAKAAAPGLELVTVNKKALQVHVGPSIIKAMAANIAQEEQAKEALRLADKKRYDLLSQLTEGIYKAAKADENIAEALVASVKDDAKAIAKMNDMIGLALGFREVITTGEGDKAKKRIGWSKAVRDMFVKPGDDKHTPEYKNKETLRTNFMTQVKKCARAALHLYEKDVVVKYDQKEGTLLISGPEVKKQFGADKVHLNEKQSVEGKGGENVVLKAKPSFNALGTAAAVEHGAVVKPREEHRSIKTMTPDEAVEAACKSFIAVVNGIKGAPTERMKKAVDAVVSAIDKGGFA